VNVKNIFPLELAFAMTIHKAQGRTLHRVILALTCHPTKRMAFAAVFVAVSQVKRRQHIRILCHYTGHIKNQTAVFAYVTSLWPNKYVLQFYTGYVNSNGPWIADLAVSAYY
jgi:hypothetical protein